MLTETAASSNRYNLQIANMLHTVATRLLLATNELSVEDTFVHTVFSHAIKSVFGAEEIIQRQWANGRLSQQNEENLDKFKPDYAAYIKIRSTRYNIAIAEIKLTNNRSSKPPSDLDKLGQQRKIMVNSLVNEHVSAPVVCGILVEDT
ncbi:hypothetical protein RMATCC62417_14584 [Rhizopus microsporus]|nr:hypothetical protein RMATCC62417_14584 [Rhizopus microsporus]